MEAEKIIAFICPLSKEGSEVRARSDDVMEHVIKPVADELGYKVQRADQMSGSVIMDDIIKMLQRADIVIADLTDLNPNVFYELGLRQAVKGKCINIMLDDGKPVPFDLNYFRVFFYKTNSSFKEGETFKRHIKERVLTLQEERWDPKMPLSTSDLSEGYGLTIVEEFLTGTKKHYAAAKKLFDRPCQTIFLMQRSSSFILSAEQGWGEEDEFLQAAKRAVNDCGHFYHIISLEGIASHLARKNSVFPNFRNFAENIEETNGLVAVKHNGPREFLLRKMPVDGQDSLFKLDRQSRVLITEDLAGVVRAVVVQNLGTDQTCFVIQGQKAKDYMRECIDYYNACDYVRWAEIEDLYQQHSAQDASALHV